MLLFRKKIKEVTDAVSAKTPEEQNNILNGLEEEMKKLPKKQRKRAEKLLKMFEKGQILQPNKDIDNKKYILERE